MCFVLLFASFFIRNGTCKHFSLMFIQLFAHLEYYTANAFLSTPARVKQYVWESTIRGPRPATTPYTTRNKPGEATHKNVPRSLVINTTSPHPVRRGEAGHINCLARGKRTAAADTNFLRIKGWEADKGKEGEGEEGNGGSLMVEMGRKRRWGRQQREDGAVKR